MRASDYLPLAIWAAPTKVLPDDMSPIPCFRNRVGEKADRDERGNPKLPLVLWRLHDPEDSGPPQEAGQPRTRVRSNLMDGPTNPLYRFFEIECRVPGDGSYAENMAEDIVSYIRGHGVLTHILLEQDEPDDTSQKSGGNYFSHLVVLGTFAEISNDRGQLALADFRNTYSTFAYNELLGAIPRLVRDELGV